MKKSTSSLSQPTASMTTSQATPPPSLTQFEKYHHEQLTRCLTRGKHYISNDDGSAYYLTSFGVLKFLEMTNNKQSKVFLMFQQIQNYLDGVAAEKMAPLILSGNGEFLEMMKSVYLMEYLYLLAYDLYQESTVRNSIKDNSALPPTP